MTGSKTPKISNPLVINQSVPIIVTCRPQSEGGQSELRDDVRLPLLAFAAETNPSNYVDIELKSMRGSEHIATSLPREFTTDSRGGLIVSYHDFSTRPDRMYNLVAEMSRLPAQVNKIVWQARSVRDNIEAFEILVHRQRPTIALCMGEAGIPSRILAKKFGAFLTFASLRQGKARQRDK